MAAAIIASPSAERQASFGFDSVLSCNQPRSVCPSRAGALAQFSVFSFQFSMPGELTTED
jgi:hypothetical protein